MCFVLTLVVGLDCHASLDFDLSGLFPGQIQLGQCKVTWYDERYRQRSYRRDIRPAQLTLLRELCSIQPVLPKAARNKTVLMQCAVVPFALLGKRTRMVSVLTFCALLWGIAATCFAGVQNYSGAFACRFFIGLGGKFLQC